jgi:hypothetical protein
MTIFRDVRMRWRFARGLREFLRHTLSLEEAREIVRRRMAEREKNFLQLVERAVFGYSRSPYLPLLRLARVELDDIRDMVRARGVEPTLLALRAAGVYITFEEFKGGKPVVRHGQSVPLMTGNFDNPSLRQYYETETGGTTGAGKRVSVDVGHLAQTAVYHALAYRAYGIFDLPMAVWQGMLPDATGISQILSCLRMGKVPDKWFLPIVGRELNRNFGAALKSRLGTQLIIAVARASGRRVPWPEPPGANQAATVARWAAEMVKARGGCYIGASASRALRACLAAEEMGLDLTGTIFSGGGEPLTPAKMRGIARVGGRCFPTYFFTELGPVGMSCAAPADSNDQHLFEDTVALIQHPEQVPGADIMVDAFHFTTLLPSAPKILLNVESDDYGVVETRSCGCPFEALGFKRHLRHIRSFHKLTGEGVTLVGGEMLRILEDVLPAKFGGSPLDYQLVEEEDEQGLTRLNLFVSPKLRIDDEAAIIETIEDELGRGTLGANMGRALWSRAHTLRIKRSEPILTGRGKLMPLHLARRSKPSSE